MKNRITELFQKKDKNILSVFYTAGFPKKADTVVIAKYLQEAGADMIEIGIPFSDPVADGPVIQESNKVSLEQGMTVANLLKQVKEIRKEVELPIVLMGYLNPVMQFGVDRFCREASEAGVDGLILPDLPLEEFKKEYQAVCEKYNLSVTFLVAPSTSEHRLREIDELSSGFIYAVSASSTTGAKNDFSEDQISYFKKLSEMKFTNPFLIGFGISTHQTFSKAARYSSGAIVGSAFISLLKSSTDFRKDITDFVGELKNGK